MDSFEFVKNKLATDLDSTIVRNLLTGDVQLLWNENGVEQRMHLEISDPESVLEREKYWHSIIAKCREIQPL